MFWHTFKLHRLSQLKFTKRVDFTTLLSNCYIILYYLICNIELLRYYLQLIEIHVLMFRKRNNSTICQFKQGPTYTRNKNISFRYDTKPNEYQITCWVLLLFWISVLPQLPQKASTRALNLLVRPEVNGKHRLLRKQRHIIPSLLISIKCPVICRCILLCW